MNDEYLNIRKNLLNNKYSHQNAHDYALAYMLDKYNAGVKISKKTNSSASFKEMKAAKTGNNYKPQICP